MARSRGWDETKRGFLHDLSGSGRPWTLEKRGSRWAVGPPGTIGILAASESRPDRWWFSLNEAEFQERRALGVFLLCASRGTTMPFGLRASQLDELLPRLSIDERGERKLNVLRSGQRFVLQVPGEQDVDLTPALGDAAWIEWLGEDATVGPAARERLATYGDRAHPSSSSEAPPPSRGGEEETTVAFFARVTGAALEPLDASGLADGDLVLVRATRVASAPASAAIRKIVARGGPRTLPADFAEEHDRYAHGGPRV